MFPIVNPVYLALQSVQSAKPDGSVVYLLLNKSQQIVRTRDEIVHETLGG